MKDYHEKENHTLRSRIVELERRELREQHLKEQQ